MNTIHGAVEEWRYIQGYEDRYMVSEFGDIKSLVKNYGYERLLRPGKRKKYGHLHVSLTNKDGVHKKKYIHIAVLEAFKCYRPLGMEGLHNDGNPLNNHISNLRWGTHKENMNDAIKHGTFSFVKSGSNHPMAVLDEKKVKEIKRLLSENILYQRQIAKMFGVFETTISQIKNNQVWVHVK